MPTPEQIPTLADPELREEDPILNRQIHRAPVCPRLEERWMRIINFPYKITHSGVITLNRLQVAKLYAGSLIGDNMIFADKLEVKNGIVIVKNPSNDPNFPSEYGQSNGLVILDRSVTSNGLASLSGLVFTVDPQDDYFIICRPVHHGQQGLLASFYQYALSKTDIDQIPLWKQKGKGFNPGRMVQNIFNRSSAR